MKYERFWTVKIILSKNNNSGGTKIPDFKLYYRTTVTKTVWYWHIGQRNRAKDPEINSQSKSLLILDKGDNSIYKINNLMLLRKLDIHI
jgi:hypothetical protein